MRHSGAGSARLASASVIRMDGGKMETAWRKRKGLLESWLFWSLKKSQGENLPVFHHVNEQKV